MHDARTLRTSLEHWVQRRRSLTELELRVVDYADQSRTKYAFGRWQKAIVEKKKLELQEGIKVKYSAVKHIVEGNILRRVFQVSLLNESLRFTCTEPALRNGYWTYELPDWKSYRINWQFQALFTYGSLALTTSERSLEMPTSSDRKANAVW